MQNERETGSIEVGKRADFVVIDRDILKIPPASVHETQVVMTFFDGKRVAGREARSRPFDSVPMHICLVDSSALQF